MIIKSIILIVIFVIGFVLGCAFALYLLNCKPQIKTEHTKKEKKRKTREFSPKEKDSISELQYEGVSEEESALEIEKIRKEQTKSYNYTKK